MNRLPQGLLEWLAILSNKHRTRRVADDAATLREALRRTPSWLGFNIELKFPTDAELQAMKSRFYSRNYFVDSVLKVRLLGSYQHSNSLSLQTCWRTSFQLH